MFLGESGRRRVTATTGRSKLDASAARRETARLARIADNYGTSACAGVEKEANQFATERSLEDVRGPRVLVMGAAVGVWIEPLLRKLAKVDVIDAVDESLKPLRSMFGDKVQTHCSLFESFTPRRKYDTVIAGHVLEHVLHPVTVLRRMKTWLTRRGRALILVPNARSIHRQIGVEMGLLPRCDALNEADRWLGHRRVYVKERLLRDIRRGGFRTSGVRGLVLKPLSNAQMESWPGPLRAAFFRLGERHPDIACILYVKAEK
jgi:2-polyprenyl-3-methyl-5-hydroxy-6-metoxy-1,4-benzoquinol methylase